VDAELLEDAVDWVGSGNVEDDRQSVPETVVYMVATPAVIVEYIVIE